ncbi:MAG: hypothetical protein WC317_01595 [Candidatus Omnitrophota bacterium]|jgi:hypothetical protein
MLEEEITETPEIDEALLKEAVQRDAGICRHLYHGTSKFLAHEIQKNTKIKIGSEIGYMGYGFYCYIYDINASKIWAREKFGEEKISVLKIVANLGDLLFIYNELYDILKEKAHKACKGNTGRLHQFIGLIIEKIIKDILSSKHGIEISAVCSTYYLKQQKESRLTTMYSLRNEEMVKDIKIEWEEL